MVVPATVGATGPVDEPWSGDDCTPHPPIRISEDHGPRGFTWTNPATGDTEPRPGSGVVEGDGSAENPFVIAGWCITAPAFAEQSSSVAQPAAIQIEETSAHVEIRGNLLDGRSDKTSPATPGVVYHQTGLELPRIGQFGIAIDNASNVRIAENAVEDHGTSSISLTEATEATVDGNTVANATVGVDVGESDRVTVTDNDVRSTRSYGVNVGHSEDVVIADNALAANDGNSVDIDGSRTVDVESNTIEDGRGSGIDLTATSQADLVDNTIVDSDRGVVVVNVVDVRVLDNHVQDAYRGVSAAGAERVIVANNSMAVENGLLVGYSEDVAVENNTVDPDGIYPVREGVGMSVYRATGTSIVNNTFETEDDGIRLRDSEKTRMEGNEIASERGITAWFATDPVIVENHVQTDEASLTLNDVDGAHVRANALEGGGLALRGDQLSHYDHEVAPTNTVNGDPIRYLTDEESPTVQEQAGQVVLVNTTDASLEGLHLSNVTTGLLVAYADGTEAANATIANNDEGIRLESTTGTRIAGTTLPGNRDVAIDVSGANGSTIANNTITGNRAGVWLTSVSGVTVADNVIEENEDGVIVTSSSTDAVVEGNDIVGNELGLGVGGQVDARGNWWGDASGPSGGERGDCTGARASGAGDEIDAWGVGGEVCFDPWLTEPNPEAGAG